MSGWHSVCRARGYISSVDLPLMHDAASNTTCGPCHAQTVHDGRIYTLKMYCGDQYPDKVPFGSGAPCRSSVGTLVCTPGGPRLAAVRWCHCPADRASLHVQAPQVRFVTRIKLSCVANNGVVRPILLSD